MGFGGPAAGGDDGKGGFVSGPDREEASRSAALRGSRGTGASSGPLPGEAGFQPTGSSSITNPGPKGEQENLGEDPFGKDAAAAKRGDEGGFSVGPFGALSAIVGNLVIPGLTPAKMAGRAALSFLGSLVDDELETPRVDIKGVAQDALKSAGFDDRRGAVPDTRDDGGNDTSGRSGATAAAPAAALAPPTPQTEPTRLPRRFVRARPTLVGETRGRANDDGGRTALLGA